jgi:3-isopropylmalate/(R)-2-methylmalate dehydratase small subunit
MDDPAHRGASVLVVESNFGCGSSREHAPQALRRAGFRAIVGESFGEIFRGNATMIGLACVTAAPAAMAAIFRFVQAHPETEVTIDLDEMTVTAGSFAAPIALPSEARTAFLTGAWDVTALLLERYAEVEQTAGRLRY